MRAEKKHTHITTNKKKLQCLSWCLTDIHLFTVGIFAVVIFLQQVICFSTFDTIIQLIQYPIFIRYAWQIPYYDILKSKTQTKINLKTFSCSFSVFELIKIGFFFV